MPDLMFQMLLLLNFLLWLWLTVWIGSGILKDWLGW